MATALYNGQLAPKEYDEIKLVNPAKPTEIKYYKAGTVVRTLTLTYEGSTENVEKIEVA